MDIRTFVLNFGLLLPFALAGAVRLAAWLVPRLPAKKPLNSGWVDKLVWVGGAAILAHALALIWLVYAHREHGVYFALFDWFGVASAVGFRVEPFALTFFFFMGALTLWAQSLRLSALASFDAQTAARSGGWLLLNMGAMGLTVFSSDALQMALLWLALPCLLYFFIRADSALAANAKRWLIQTEVASAMAAFGVLWLCRRAQTSDLQAIRTALFTAALNPVYYASLLILIGVCLRWGFVPLHRAPAALFVAAGPRARLLLTAALPMLDVFVFTRACYAVLPTWALRDLNAPMLVLGMLSLLGGVGATRLREGPEERLALMHLCHTALTLVGLATLLPSGVVGAWLHLFTQAVGKALLVDRIREPTAPPQRQTQRTRAQRLHRACLGVALGSLAGVPLTLGFHSLRRIAAALWMMPGRGTWLLAMAVWAAALASAWLLWRSAREVPAPAQLRKREPPERQPAWTRLLPALTGAAAIIAAGVWTGPTDWLAALLQTAAGVRTH